MKKDTRTINWINQVLSEISQLDGKKGLGILKSCGKACCTTSDLYQGAIKIRQQHPTTSDPDLLFDAFKIAYYNNENISKTGDTITLIFEACTCPMVKDGIENPFFCHCTTGYSEKIFETLFDRKVTVELEKSILRGDAICKQLVRIMENDQ
jgi:predicted ArsR family transcriptional regulator